MHPIRSFQSLRYINMIWIILILPLFVEFIQVLEWVAESSFGVGAFFIPDYDVDGPEFVSGVIVDFDCLGAVVVRIGDVDQLCVFQHPDQVVCCCVFNPLRGDVVGQHGDAAGGPAFQEIRAAVREHSGIPAKVVLRIVIPFFPVIPREEYLPGVVNDREGSAGIGLQFFQQFKLLFDVCYILFPSLYVFSLFVLLSQLTARLNRRITSSMSCGIRVSHSLINSSGTP